MAISLRAGYAMTGTDLACCVVLPLCYSYVVCGRTALHLCYVMSGAGVATTRVDSLPFITTP